MKKTLLLLLSFLAINTTFGAVDFSPLAHKLAPSFVGAKVHCKAGNDVDEAITNLNKSLLAYFQTKTEREVKSKATHKMVYMMNSDIKNISGVSILNTGATTDGSVRACVTIFGKFKTAKK